MSRALIVVDVQKDFTEGGSLAVMGGKKVAKLIREHIFLNQGNYAVVVFSKDWHIGGDHTNAGHFAKRGDAPDFVDTWPAHCVQDSPGSDFDEALQFDALPDVVPVFHVFRKGRGVPAYSAFEGFNDAGLTLHRYLSQFAKVEGVDVVGIATDYCVKATMLSAAELGYDTRLLLNLTAAVAGPVGKGATVKAAEIAGITVRV